MQNDKKPSDIIRAFMAEARDNPYRQEIQLKLLDDAFRDFSKRLEGIVQTHATTLANKLAGFGANPEIRQERMIGLIESGTFSPKLFASVALNMDSTDFSVHDITDLPAYVKLHEEARLADVGVNVVGFTKNEKTEPYIIIDTGVTYEDGRAGSNYGYPYLRDEDQAPAQQPRPEPEAKRLSPPRSNSKSYRF